MTEKEKPDFIYTRENKASWQRYACAALSGLMSQVTVDFDPVLAAAHIADRMLELEMGCFHD